MLIKEKNVQISPVSQEEIEKKIPSNKFKLSLENTKYIYLEAGK